MKRKNLICLLLCAAVLFSLQACGSKDEKDAGIKEDASIQASGPIEIEPPEGRPVEATPSAMDKEKDAAEEAKMPDALVPVNSAPETPVITTPTPVDTSELYSVYNNTLFIGDSRTEGFRLHSGVNNAAYFCAKSLTVDKIVDGQKVAMGGRKVSVQDMVAAGTYEKVIISVGLNELGWNHIEDFIKEYKALIKLVKDGQPDAVIYVQAVLPVTAEKSANHSYVNNNQIYWYNTHIVEMAKETGVNYVNPAPGVVGIEGNLMAEGATDGIHFNKEYCQKWAAYLAEML